MCPVFDNCFCCNHCMYLLIWFHKIATICELQRPFKYLLNLYPDEMVYMYVSLILYDFIYYAAPLDVLLARVVISCITFLEALKLSLK